MEFINGLNCTILCYGQTGSGKTYTLFGPDAATSCSLNLTPRSGIVPRACAEVFAAVARRREAGIECALQMSYIEVFGEQVSKPSTSTLCASGFRPQVYFRPPQ